MPAWVAPVAAAGVTGVANLLGSNKASKSATKAASIQSSAASEALKEQRRIFDMQYEQEQRDRASRRQIFSRYGLGSGDGMPNSFGNNVQPPPSDYRTTPVGGFVTGSETPQPGLVGTDYKSGSMSSTVFMRAPTGEVMEVSLDQAPMLTQRGAVIVPGPMGMGQTFGANNGMV